MPWNCVSNDDRSTMRTQPGMPSKAAVEPSILLPWSDCSQRETKAESSLAAVAKCRLGGFTELRGVSAAQSHNEGECTSLEESALQGSGTATKPPLTMSFPGKILIVDDEAHVRKFVGLIVRGLGEPAVIEASDGKEALAKYAAEAPDLVLLDVNMPVLDGVHTLAALLKTGRESQDRHADLPGQPPDHRKMPQRRRGRLHPERHPAGRDPEGADRDCPGNFRRELSPCRTATQRKNPLRPRR